MSHQSDVWILILHSGAKIRRRAKDRRSTRTSSTVRRARRRPATPAPRRVTSTSTVVCLLPPLFLPLHTDTDCQTQVLTVRDSSPATLVPRRNLLLATALSPWLTSPRALPAPADTAGVSSLPTRSGTSLRPRTSTTVSPATRVNFFETAMPSDHD